MKFFVVFVALLACVAAYEVELLTEEQWDNFMNDQTIDAETRGLILNSQAKKAVRNFVNQMPCGWPEYGIPPLAPYTNPDLEVHLAKSFVDAIVQAIKFRFDGLEDMEIKKLKVSYTFNKKVKFHFNFKQLKATASVLNTDTFVDLMKELGLSVRYEGSGPMEFSLENLSLQGQFKYKMPFIFGSIKIYKFECVVTLGGVRSNIGGILGNGKINEMINDEIDYLIPALINGNQKKISDTIEQVIVPRVNAMMKGKKIWSMLGMLASSNKKCVPTPAPFLE
uniref:Hemolymph juvenile hormone binding protein (JHBP) n=1 Tax=Musca domestica TaxID=7370 RepID=A0A1I8MRI5_MUSDO